MNTQSVLPMMNQGTLASKVRSLWEVLRPAQLEAVTASANRDDWQVAVLGAEMCADPATVCERQKLLSGLLAGEPTAISLVGLLLVFRAATVEKMPMLLKDLGEAFYRWHPLNTNQPSQLEAFLLSWLSATCHKAGLPNSIGLVRPGERFDAARHYAMTPGVEVAQVQGWIVFRENGKVYAKARVTAK